MSRIRSTDQAEVIATVLFSYDELSEHDRSVTEKQILDHVMNWKSHWKGEKEQSIASTIISLSVLGWMAPDGSRDSLDSDDWMY